MKTKLEEEIDGERDAWEEEVDKLKDERYELSCYFKAKLEGKDRTLNEWKAKLEAKDRILKDLKADQEKGVQIIKGLHQVKFSVLGIFLL